MSFCKQIFIDASVWFHLFLVAASCVSPDTTHSQLQTSRFAWLTSQGLKRFHLFFTIACQTFIVRDWHISYSSCW